MEIFLHGNNGLFAYSQHQSILHHGVLPHKKSVRLQKHFVQKRPYHQYFTHRVEANFYCLFQLVPQHKVSQAVYHTVVMRRSFHLRKHFRQRHLR